MLLDYRQWDLIQGARNAYALGTLGSRFTLIVTLAKGFHAEVAGLKLP